MYGRKHCYRLYTKLLNEATRWASAIQNVTDTKAPIDTPTQQLIQDIKVRRGALGHQGLGVGPPPDLCCHHDEHWGHLELGTQM